MTQADKARILLDGVPLAATQSVVWQFVSGSAPYQTGFTVHERDWPKLERRMGVPLRLEIRDARGVETVIQDVYVLNQAPADSPHRVAFTVADKRWKWAYRLIARDYNIQRKTGNRTLFGDVPAVQSSIDEYDYLRASLTEDGKRWTAEAALRDALEVLEPGGYVIESFPLRGEGDVGEFSLQNVSLRDAGDAAIARLLAYIPGADCYVRADGKIAIYDSTSISAAEQYFAGLPPSQWGGDASVFVDRAAIRPDKVVVHYEREVEVLFHFADNWSGSTTTHPFRSEPFLENVIPTTDPTTRVTEWDPETGEERQKQVTTGTWVEVRSWLDAMDQTKPEGAFPWDFDTIRAAWVAGNLESLLGADDKDLATNASVQNRVAALREHFRQTFRINPRMMQRVRNLRAIRVATMDPVTGSRAPAAAWGQTCIRPSRKGSAIAANAGTAVFRNVDAISAAQSAGTSIVNTTMSAIRVTVLDEQLGIFHIAWAGDPSGRDEAFTPGLLVDDGESESVATRDLAEQDRRPVMVGGHIEGAATGLFLKKQMELYALLTIVPAAPNNELQFHRAEIKPDEVSGMFRGDVTITGGKGPTLDVYVAPGEETARFAWEEDSAATATIQDLLGLRDDNPRAGVEGPDLPGFLFANDGEPAGFRQLQAHARAVAAEALIQYEDSRQGAVMTVVPQGGVKLAGSMGGAAIRVAEYPSAKVDAVHQFSGQPRAISRFSLMPNAVRRMVLGIVSFR